MERRPRWPACVLAGLLALGACVRAAPAPASQEERAAAPAPARPVAPIVSSSWDTEESRDRHGEARRVFDLLRLSPGDRVADIGAGSGYYTVRLARRLGPASRVYAQDVNGAYLEELRLRLAREGLAWVETVQGTPGDPRLPPASIDVALLGHMYHEIENPYEFFRNLHRALAPGARVAIVDVDRPTASHGTPPGLLRCELGALGYREREFWMLTPAAGYLAVFEAPDEVAVVERGVRCE